MRLEARKYLRDILIHGYAAVDDRIVWGVVERYLEQLRSAVQGLLDTPE
jgi:uncharacterized protein with HEPN domain